MGAGSKGNWPLCLNDNCYFLYALNKMGPWLKPVRNTGLETHLETQTFKGLEKTVLEEAQETPSGRFLSFQGKLSDTCVILHRCLFNLFLGLLKCSFLQTQGSGAHTNTWVLVVTPMSCGFGKSTKYCKSC